MLRAIQYIPEVAGTFEPENFAREEYLGEHPGYSGQGRSIPSPSVSEVMFMHEERERQHLSVPTSASVGSVSIAFGECRVYMEVRGFTSNTMFSVSNMICVGPSFKAQVL